MKGKVNALYDKNRLLRKKLDGMEGQSRRNNIIVRGIPEKTDGRESWEDCEQALRESLVTKLGMARERADKMPIERAHRLHKSAGRPAGTARNVLVKLSIWKDKDTILSCVRRLKPEHMCFLEDFSDSGKTARAKLNDLLGKVRQLELKSYLSCMCMMTVVIVWKLCERRLRMDCWKRTRLTLRMVQMMDPTNRLLALRTQTHRIMAVSLVYALGILMDICLMKIRQLLWIWLIKMTLPQSMKLGM